VHDSVRWLLRSTHRLYYAGTRWTCVFSTGTLFSTYEAVASGCFFNAVNLEAGRHSVIGEFIESRLGKHDLRLQWREPAEDDQSRIAEQTPLGAVVAASTAFPPWFGPVPLTIVSDRRRPAVTQHFVDGGVTDNAGFKLARGLSLY
jgi:predicted acylesterase/phospholipase RssA